MENTATCAPWLSSLSLITAKMRQTGISPALKQRKKLWWKVQDIGNHTGSVHLSNTPCSRHREVTRVPSPLCSTSSAWRLIFFFFQLFFHLQRCLLQPLVWFLYFKELIPKCSHDTSPDPCPPLLFSNIYSNHCTILEDDCEQPWPLPAPWVTMWGDPWLQHSPQVCQTCPPQTILQPNT